MREILWKRSGKGGGENGGRGGKQFFACLCFNALIFVCVFYCVDICVCV